MPFPRSVKEDALVACGRCCCLCHRFCGIKMEIHHIKPESKGGLSDLDNAIPLCLDCHADMRTYDHDHPKGTKYSENELRRHRDNWFEKGVSRLSVPQGDQIAETDRSIYKLLLEKLPWNGSIRNLSALDFASHGFGLYSMEQIFDFEELCKNPSFEFVDPDLESLRSKLYKLIAALTSLIASQTLQVQGRKESWREVPRELEEKDPRKFKETVDKMNGLASELCRTYREIVRLATRKLGVLPEIIK